MSQTNPAIRCKECGLTFEPDVKTKGTWPCPSCQTKNPNLKRHRGYIEDISVLRRRFRECFRMAATFPETFPCNE
jgi:Zn finger protein HypA/HybF involved in hydrogenase expression